MTDPWQDVKDMQDLLESLEAIPPIENPELRKRNEDRKYELKRKIQAMCGIFT